MYFSKWRVWELQKEILNEKFRPLWTHPRRPRGGQSEKRCNKSFQAQGDKPLGTDSHWTISKPSSICWFLIGHKKCFVLLYPIGEQHLLSFFREFVNDGYWLDHGLSGLCTKEMYAVRKLSVWYKTLHFKILSSRKLKMLFQKYKLELTTGIHACIDHAFVNIGEFKMSRQLRATKTSHDWVNSHFSISIVIIPTCLLYQKQANSSGPNFLSSISKFINRQKILSLLAYVLHKTWN